MEALKSWKEEKRSAYLYRFLATAEVNPIHKKLFADLAEMAEHQAKIWEEQLKLKNIVPATYHPDLRTRLLTWLVQCVGAKSLKIALAAMKIRGMSIYQGEKLDKLIPQTTLPDEMEHRHHGVNSSNNIRAAVFGISDGLLSNASLMLGIVGANAHPHFILLSGIAGLLAGACSMGAGEYVSVRSQREMLEYQLALEKNELELYPEEEAAELALIYQARGLPKEEAERVSNLLIKDPQRALNTLAREELGINPKELVSPWGAAVSSFFSFAVGAFVPLLPFLFSYSAYTLFFSIALTGLALFTVGALLSLFTQRDALWSGLRMLVIGTLAGSLTYVIGHAVGVSF